MRTFNSFQVALNEIRRDVAEMGIIVHPHSYQDKIVQGIPAFDTLEIQNYVYSVTQPDPDNLKPIQPWADSEWNERLSGIWGYPVNPGEAWKLRAEVWRPFLNDDGEFSYSYPLRLSSNQQVTKIIQELVANPDSRQCFISIWDDSYINEIGGRSRVPCSIGYQIQVRHGAVNLTYIQRSADLVTHFENDVWLAAKVQEFIAEELKLPRGIYCHHIFSLHMFRKDAEGIF